MISFTTPKRLPNVWYVQSASMNTCCGVLCERRRSEVVEREMRGGLEALHAQEVKSQMRKMKN